MSHPSQLTARDCQQSSTVRRYKADLEMLKSDLNTVLNSGCVGEDETDTLKYVVCRIEDLIAERDYVYLNIARPPLI